MENPEKIEIAGLKTIHKLCNFGADRNMEGCTFTEIVERMFDELAKAQAVQEGFVLVEKELSWVKADHLACAEWEKNKALFCTENRDITALQIEEYRLRWCKNKAHKIMSEYKAMIEAQEPAND